METKSKRRRELLMLAVPVAVVLVLALLSLLPAYRNAELGTYDIMLNFRAEPAEREDILLLNVDDLAIAQVGMWPWSRHIMADGLLLLSELGSDRVVLDIEYVDTSPMGVDAELLQQEIPARFRAEFGDLSRQVRAFFEALEGGMIPLEEAGDFIGELDGLTANKRDTLLELVGEIARDNDEYLGRAAAAAGNVFATVNMLPDEIGLIAVSERLREYTREQIPLAELSGGGDGGNESAGGSGFRNLRRAGDIQPTIYPVMTGVRGAGFPNVVVDPDGVRRRLDLVIEYEGRYYPQLAFGPTYDLLGRPEIEMNEDRVVLRDAELDGETIDRIEIPIGPDGRVLINWPQKGFTDKFRHFSFNNLVLHDRYEQNLLANIEMLDGAGYLRYHDGEYPIMQLANGAEQLRERLLEAPEGAIREEYAQVRELLFNEIGVFLDGSAESRLREDITAAIESGQLSDVQLAEQQEILRELPEVFEVLERDYARLMDVRRRTREAVEGAMVFIGHTGISTTDIGVNPFEEQYMNVGTHASFANMILQREFLRELPWWVGLVIGLVAAVAVTLISRPLSPRGAIAVGLGGLVVTLVAVGALFVFADLYVPMLTPSLAVFLTFLVISLIKFVRTESEKSFLRNAFSRYLSADVISQLIDDPARLTLGGEKKELTALFTDVKGFSTISETMDPSDLVRLLNRYLGEMSDTILDLRGTIDKYEGDAIIAFFGAPLDFPDHAESACLATVRMKKLEAELNKAFLEEGLSPTPLYTRIGINTGEMVVGNMGTPKKMDYTIMGNAVNLAARLEGVNKQYGTWTLMSEATREAAGDGFLVRKLDRVRVVGISEPVRLYELIDELSEADAEQREKVELFHAGLERFEQRDWNGCNGYMEQVLTLDPEDGPTRMYLDRLKNYKATPPPPNWDGVFSLTAK